MPNFMFRRTLILFVLVSGAFANEKPTVEEARAFLEKASAEMMRLQIEGARASWINATYITPDTDLIASKTQEKAIVAAVSYANESRRFDGLDLPDDLKRQFRILKAAITLPTPSDPKLAEELTQVVTAMRGMYGKGKYCDENGNCRSLGELSNTLASSRNPAELKEAWRGWRTVSPDMRDLYTRYVELSNQGAQELGYKNLGEMWLSNYDMAPADFAAEVDRLWAQVKPLYESLHAYVRMRLRQHYGNDVVPAKGPIPAHLLGNMWSQSWSNIYPLVAPKDGDPGYNLTSILNERNIDAVEMVKIGERFFTSVGFEPLPESFWSNSMFVKPEDRDVVCHASAWSIDYKDDLRIKMCIQINEEDFITVHHELGHNFYQRAYNHLPLLFQDSANDGFHEAVGDTLALSITPKYLVELGYLDEAPDPSKDIGLLLRQALDKVAFLPFGLLIDKWRWQVFSGDVSPENYNASWWSLREQYQGIAAPVDRSENDFDPGAKYHVPANVPYLRYFLAHVLQFQFHRALAEEAGETGPLNRASIYGNKQAGAKLEAMLKMGQSKPWPDALEALSGQRQMDATAIIDYFAPLQKWLDKQLEDQPKGW